MIRQHQHAKACNGGEIDDRDIWCFEDIGGEGAEWSHEGPQAKRQKVSDDAASSHNLALDNPALTSPEVQAWVTTASLQELADANCWIAIEMHDRLALVTSGWL